MSIDHLMGVDPDGSGTDPLRFHEFADGRRVLRTPSMEPGRI